MKSDLDPYAIPPPLMRCPGCRAQGRTMADVHHIEGCSFAGPKALTLSSGTSKRITDDSDDDSTVTDLVVAAAVDTLMSSDFSSDSSVDTSTSDTGSDFGGFDGGDSGGGGASGDF